MPTFAFMLLSHSFFCCGRAELSRQRKQTESRPISPPPLERAEGMWNKSKREA